MTRDLQVCPYLLFFDEVRDSIDIDLSSLVNQKNTGWALRDPFYDPYTGSYRTITSSVTSCLSKFNVDFDESQ